MNKLLRLYDKYFLKFGIAFLLLFTVLYPKLPSIHIMRTWVYIRLEDFFILILAIAWIVQVFRKKAKIPFGLSIPIFAYWAIGLISVVYSVLFIGPYLSNFFPHIAVLNYFRRIEYMILFFIAFSTVKSYKDLRDYFIVICTAIVGSVIYGYGQHFYLRLWALFPDFFTKVPFCFPSFQTGNEEFAKGIPLCLPENARITSTFGGHYDLAAYLVLVLPIVLITALTIKRRLLKISTLLLFVSGLILLIFTASRISFASYLISVSAALIFFRKKLLIIPVIGLSILLLVSFSESTAKRFLSTFRISNVVTDSQGQLVGETLPQSLKDKISESESVYTAPPPAQNLPVGSGFIGLPEKTTQVATSVAVVKKTLTPEEARRLKLAGGSVEISTVSGEFLIKKALVYDISFTTRFQAEWPNAMNAFARNPLLGSGYSSITLATDGDYFRALGETGLLGLISFLSIFLVYAIALRHFAPGIENRLAKGFVYGLAGGVVGIGANAFLIDVFEASKVAENMWMMMGIGAGGFLLVKAKPVPYMAQIKRVIFSRIMIAMYLFFMTLAALIPFANNFFIADDFTWLRWAASSVVTDIPNYFVSSQDFFYRPLMKTIMFFLYMLFSFQPQGYYVFIYLLHFAVVFGVYILSLQVGKNKFAAFASAVLFMLLASHFENIFWISTMHILLCAVFIIYSLISYIRYKNTKSIFSLILSIALAVFAFLSYELAVIMPVLIFAVEVLLYKSKISRGVVIKLLPFALLVVLYFAVRTAAQAFTGGGDYSYNLGKIVPNFVGNTFGYVSLFFAGPEALHLYNFLRASLRENMVYFIVIFALILIVLYFVLKNYRKGIWRFVKDKDNTIIFFGAVFGFIALLPYYGLGNIAPRYSYLASAGFSIALTALTIKIIFKFVQNRMIGYAIFVLLLLAFSLYQRQSLFAENKNWVKAGDYTENVLTEFRTFYEYLTPDARVYLINVPTKFGNAWVYPIGIEDSLWFIYRENSPSINRVSSKEDAINRIKTDKAKEYYIFELNEKGVIKEINL